jgi:hypothetical protein
MLMNKCEFRTALRRNNLTPDEFAALVGRSLSTVYDFGGRYPVPYYARILITLLDERGGAHGLIHGAGRQ